MSAIYASGHRRPTLIQHFAIPEILLGRNTLIAAETGSGKTLAYAAPVLHMLMGASKGCDAPRALVLTLGRELAIQTCDMIGRLIGKTGLKVDLKITERLVENDQLLNEQDVIVGTPGILNKMVREEKLNLERLSHVIIDEADSLLDDSFSGMVIEMLSTVKVSMRLSSVETIHC